jgi:hypothetical protein
MKTVVEKEVITKFKLVIKFEDETDIAMMKQILSDARSHCPIGSLQTVYIAEIQAAIKHGI